MKRHLVPFLLFAVGLPCLACGPRQDPGSADGNAADAADAGDDQTSYEKLDPLPDLAKGVSTLTGRSVRGFRDGDRHEARLNNPVNVAIGPDDNLYVCDFDNNKLRRVTPEGDVSTLPTPANFSWPYGMVFVDHRLYVQTDHDSSNTQAENGALWLVSIKSGSAKLLIDKTGLARGLVGLPDGRIVMADYRAHLLSLLNPSSKRSTPLAGAKGSAGYSDGKGAAVRFNVPYDMVLTKAGEIILADSKNNRLRSVSLDGTVKPYAGTGTAGTADGSRFSAQFNEPQALAIDAAGNVYVTDSGSYRVRKITATGAVSTLAGDGKAGYKDGPPSAAQFFGLEGLDVTADGALLYIADGNRGRLGSTEPYHRIRRLTLK